MTTKIEPVTVFFDFYTGSKRIFSEHESFPVQCRNTYDDDGDLSESSVIEPAKMYRSVEARARELMDIWNTDSVYYQEEGEDEKTWVYSDRSAQEGR